MGQSAGPEDEVQLAGQVGDRTFGAAGVAIRPEVVAARLLDPDDRPRAGNESGALRVGREEANPRRGDVLDDQPAFVVWPAKVCSIRSVLDDVFGVEPTTATTTATSLVSPAGSSSSIQEG